MSGFRTIIFTLIFMIAGGPALQACLWDYDTLAMERQEFPGTHELIVGHFSRHSDTYYRWRIEDRSKKPVEDRLPADYDDIAVAHDKLGEHNRAIEVIKNKIARWPDQHEYESQANLGTFLIHSGDLEAGLVHIKKAIELNPDAHFGREIYQQRLVEFILFRQNELGQPTHSFYQYLVNKSEPTKQRLEKEDIKKAIRGIEGMLRFGNHDSPILLESLGSLLSVYNHADSNMIAARAYLMASYQTKDQTTSKNFREHAESILEMQVSHNLQRVEKELKNEIKQAEAFFAQIKADEKSWVEAGLNLDEKFKEKYYDSPSLRIPFNFLPANPILRIGVLSLLGIGTLSVLTRWISKRWRRRKLTAKPVGTFE